MSKEISAKNEKRVGRPIIIRKKDGYINDVKIKSKIYDYNFKISELFSSNNIILAFGIYIEEHKAFLFLLNFFLIYLLYYYLLIFQ